MRLNFRVGLCAWLLTAYLACVSSSDSADHNSGLTPAAASLTLIPVVAAGRPSGQAVRVRVQARDTSGAPLAGATVAMAANDANIQFSLRQGPTDANGALLVSIASGVAGTFSIAATVGEQTRIVQVAFAPTCTTIAFARQQMIPLASQGQQSLAWGDINGDGSTDLLAQSDLGRATGLLNESDGGLWTRGPFDGGDSLQILAPTLADLTGDGAVDAIAATGEIPKALALFRNIGNGTFNPAFTVPTSISSRPLLADVDGDGRIDIVGTSTTDNTLVVLKGSGNGQFTSNVYVLVPASQAGDVALADFDGDGRIDAVAGNANGALSLFINDTPNGFAKASPLTLSDGAAALAAGDVDNDGDMDLVAVGSSSGNLDVALNQGAGTFQSLPPMSIAQGVGRPMLADVDSDGILDLVVGIPTANSTQVYKGQGDGTFQTAATFDVGLSQPRDWAVVDLNDDGRPDLAVAAHNATMIMLNTCQ